MLFSHVTNIVFAALAAFHPPNQMSTSSSNYRRSSSPARFTNLPGPSQVVTHPGQTGINPITGERQRRRGVSGPPSGNECCLLFV